MSDPRKTFRCIKCGFEINDIDRYMGRDTKCPNCLRIEYDERIKKEKEDKKIQHLIHQATRGSYGLFGIPRTDVPKHNEKVDDEKRYDTIRELIKMQGCDGSWNFNSYNLGIFNGMEAILALMEDREPVLRTCKNEDFLDKSFITLKKCTAINCDYNHADVCFLKEDRDIGIYCYNAGRYNNPVDEKESDSRISNDQVMDILKNKPEVTNMFESVHTMWPYSYNDEALINAGINPRHNNNK